MMARYERPQGIGAKGKKYNPCKVCRGGAHLRENCSSRRACRGRLGFHVGTGTDMNHLYWCSDHSTHICAILMARTH